MTRRGDASFLETVESARAFLERNGRVSLRALQRAYGLDRETLEELAAELVDVQQVAAREGKLLTWIGAPSAEGSAAGDDSSSPVVAERRQLSVLFCDLVDSTEMVSAMDPEDWREVVRRFQEVSAAVFERFAGHVAQYLGDGLLVYFGFPRAHEDDPERAVRAGLGVLEALSDLNPELERSYDVRLGARIGVHSGPVVIGEMGGGPTRATLAMGDTPNIAARLQAVAEPDSVVLSAATLRLVPGLFVTRHLGAHRLKGVERPVDVYRADRPSGMRGRLGAASGREITPFVGREPELALLAARWQEAHESRGQAIVVCGEPGIGKSRLVQAFRERLRSEEHTWLECRASPYTRDSALQPLHELHLERLGLRPDDPPERQLARVEADLAAQGFELADAMPLMAAFHSLPLPDRYTEPTLSPEGRRRKTLELLTEWLLRLGREQPVALLVEDLHWIDPSTVELLGCVLEQLPPARALLLLTHRPEFEPPWPSHEHVSSVRLSRLGREQSARLIRKVTRERQLPDAWVDEIADRADGVPLFAEELAKLVLESGPEDEARGRGKVCRSIAELGIPATVQDLLMARLDSLGPMKGSAQLAAVIGREFDYGLLLAVSDLTEEELRAALGAAVDAGLLYQRGAPPDASYQFRHSLIRDAAYESILRSTRQRHHLEVAETLIERAPQVAELQPERVAHHLSESPEKTRAIEWWVRAGERATRRADYAEAIAAARRGLALLPAVAEPEVRREAELCLLMIRSAASMAVLGFSHPETREACTRAYDLSDVRTDPRRAAVIRYHLFGLHASLAEYPRATELAEEVLEIGRDLGDRTLELAGLHCRGNVLLYTGEIAKSRECFLESRSVPGGPCERLGHLEYPGVLSWAWLSWCHAIEGSPERSRAAVAAGLELAEQLRHPYSLCCLTGWGAVAAMFRRDWEEARRLGAEAARLGAEHRLWMFLASGTFAQAAAAAHAGDASAVDGYARAMTRTASTGSRALGPTILIQFTDSLVAVGRFEEASPHAESAFEMVRATGERLCLAELHRLKGQVLLGLGSEAEEAERHFRRSIGIARRQGARLFELRSAIQLARLWRGRQRLDEARGLLQPLLGRFDQDDEGPDLAVAQALRQELG